jgi:AraC family transcriptional regulator
MLAAAVGQSDNGGARSVLSPVLLGPATLLQSSAPLNWGGVLVEKYVCRPGERSAGNVLDAPVLAMLCTPGWRGEHVAADGMFAPHSKTVGALTVVPHGPLPAARSLQQCDLLYCAFDHGLVSEVRNEIEGDVPPSLGLRSGVRDHAISEILNLLLGEVELGGVSTRLYIDSLAHALTVRFLFLGGRTSSQPRGAATLTRRKLSRVQELIESRLDADLTLQDLAVEVGYSRSHFLRAFHATTGVTPHRYVLNRRIERARRLLGETDTIAEVAYRCGFSSQAHLTLAFRKVCGLTPGEYRRELQAEHPTLR